MTTASRLMPGGGAISPPITTWPGANCMPCPCAMVIITCHAPRIGRQTCLSCHQKNVPKPAAVASCCKQWRWTCAHNWRPCCKRRHQMQRCYSIDIIKSIIKDISMLLKPHSLPLQLLALSILPLSAATAATAASGPALDAAVRQRAELLVRNGSNASIVIAVTDGKNSAVYGFGRARPDSNTVPDADTVYEIGSVTKTMTALLLADAVVVGKARLDEP